MTAVLTSPGHEMFKRAQQLASRKKQKSLSDGETVEVLADHYLDSFDPDRKLPRKRRMPRTDGRPGRHTAAATDREVVGRHGDCCSVPGCDHRIWLHKAHIRPYRAGGSREAWNFHYLCRAHHILYDTGLMNIRGTADEPVFYTALGDFMGGRCSRGPPG